MQQRYLDSGKLFMAHTLIGYLNDRDHALMRRVNRWRAPLWIRLWMVCATRGGDGWLWYAMCVAVLLFGGADRWAAVGAAMLAGTVGVGLFIWLKRATGRRRPLPPPHAPMLSCGARPQRDSKFRRDVV